MMARVDIKYFFNIAQAGREPGISSYRLLAKTWVIVSNLSQ